MSSGCRLSCRGILAGLRQFTGSDLVFTADGRRAATGFTSLKQQLDGALSDATVKEFTFHDFRRSATTWMVRTKAADSIVADRLLAHTGLARVSPVASTYNLYDFETERKAALERWVAFLVDGEAATGASAPPMLPAPKVETTTATKEAESRTIFWPTGMKDQIEASEAQAEENFISVLLRIGSRRDVNVPTPKSTSGKSLRPSISQRSAPKAIRARSRLRP